MVYNQSFVSGTWSATDQYGHGTHIAGLIAGDGASSKGSKYSRTFEGIAPGANLINLRVLDQNGAGTDSAVIAAIAQAITLKGLFNIRVINLSLGRPVYESYKLDPVCQAVEAAWKNGIVVVVAAGNDGRYQPTNGYATINSPGNDPYVLTVGAMKPMGTPTRNDDLIASYSSKGPTAIDHIVKPDLVAPGNLLVSLEAPGSTLYNEYPGNRVPYSYYVNGGSSASSSSLLHAERNQHGCRRSQRSRRRSTAEESATHARPGESPPDEDGLEVFAVAKQRLRSDYGTYLHRSVRHVHSRRRLRGC